jgi:hypothetical protein
MHDPVAGLRPLPAPLTSEAYTNMFVFGINSELKQRLYLSARRNTPNFYNLLKQFKRFWAGFIKH